MENILFLFKMGWPAFFCLLLGLALVVLEMATPGFALPGIAGLILLGVSVYLATDNLMQVLVMVLLILVVLAVCAVIIIRSAQKGKLSRSPLIQRRTSSGEEGYSTNPDMSYLLGKQGTAKTVLRPSGLAEFDGKKVDVVAEGEFIPQGTAVQVSQVEGVRVVVKPVQQPEGEMEV